MKKAGLPCFLLLVFSGVVMAQNKKAEAFHFSGSGWGKYEGHRMSIEILDTSVRGVQVFAEQIIKNGKFSVSGKLQYPQNAFFGMYNPNGDFVYKQEFIIEPDKLIINYDSATSGIIVSGGKYNTLFNAVRTDPQFKALEKKLKDFSANLKQEDYKVDSISKKYNELWRAPYLYKWGKYNDIRDNHPDPYARLLASFHSDRSAKFEEQINALEKKMGPLPELVYLKYSIKKSNERRNVIALKTGSVIHDFNAKDLSDKAFQVADVLKENKYTLVEFWASWCGPCRAEIPHMKKAYERFNKKGFQIVSFTLDHDRARWNKASTEEKLPWVNVGDLLAYKSPVVKMFGISGVPANYLVDSSGKIIAMNLRQNNLDEKLAELLEH